MNKRLWYINAALAAVLVISWIFAIAGMPGYPSEAIFDKSDLSPASDNSGDADVESQTIAAARGFSNWLDPPPAYGSVKVKIEPEEVLGVGAGWRVGGSEWLESEAVAEKITPGEKNLSFKVVKGWLVPEVKVVVEKDKLAEVNAVYAIPPRGFVKVTVKPEEILSHSPQWQIDGGQWLNSGDTSQVTPVGQYGLTFKDIEGWDKPAINVTIEDQKTVETEAEYVLIRYGNINVKVKGGESQPEAAAWKINNGEWLALASEPQRNRFGSYVVSFKEVPDWKKPEDVKVNIDEEKTYDIETAYTPIPYARVTTNISPVNDERLSTAQWRIDEGEWLNFGQTNSKVTMGEHVISFKSVAGWQPVENLKVEIKEQTDYEFACEYIRQRPAGPTFKFRSVIETGGGNGVAFISAQKGYKVGEEIEGFRLKHVAKGKVILEKEGFEYELEVADNSQLVAPDGASPVPVQPGQPVPGRPEGVKPPMPPTRPRQ